MTEAPEETISETSEETFYEPRPREKKRRGRRGVKKREKGAEIAMSFKRIKLLEYIIAVSFCAIIITNKLASLACAARLADTACPQSLPAGA